MNEEKRKQLEKALSFLDGKQEEMMGLLERLVKQESGNPDKEGCDAMCALMEEQLKKLGAKTTVVSMEKKGNFLYGERIRRSTGAYPKEIDSRLEGFENVVFRSNLRRDIHPSFLFYPFQPRKTDYTDAFEASGLGTRLPNACAKYFNAF